MYSNFVIYMQEKNIEEKKVFSVQCESFVEQRSFDNSIDVYPL